MRLFVALTLSDETVRALTVAQGELERSCRGVRWVKPEQLHVTMKFLGEVADANVPEVCDALAMAAGECSSASVEIGNCGCFPPRGPVRIVWAGMTAGGEEPVQWARQLEDAMESIGFAREQRPFSPHITIGRVKVDNSGGRIRAAVEGHRFGPIGQRFDGLTLMSSVLSPSGPSYTAVSRAPLGRAVGEA